MKFGGLKSLLVLMLGKRLELMPLLCTERSWVRVGIESALLLPNAVPKGRHRIPKGRHVYYASENTLEDDWKCIYMQLSEVTLTMCIVT